MSYYPKQYPVLQKVEWRLDARDELRRGTFDDTLATDNGPQLIPGRTSGTYTGAVIDAGQAVAWKDLIWEVDLPPESALWLRTRFGATEEECLAARWSARYRSSPARISLAGGRESHVRVAAARYLQVRAEMTVGTGGTPTLRKVRLTAGLVAPALVGPMNRGLTPPDKSPVFYWTRVEGAAGYCLELSNTCDFSGQVFRQEGIADSEFVSPAPLSRNTYYWRVRAVDGTGQVSDYSPVREFVVGERPRVAPASLKHPYLFFSEADLQTIRQNLPSRHPAGCRALLARADEALEAERRDEKDVLMTPGQHGDFHALAAEVARGQLEALALSYLITGNRAYADKAREIMLHLAGYSRWTGIPFGDPNFCYPTWQAALETAGICKGVATAYDWLYDYLGEDDRATIRAGLLRLGILPIIESWADPKTIRHIPRHQLPAGNWWSVCNSGAGIGALALLGDVPDAQRWVEMAADAIRAYLCYPGGDTWNIDMKAGHGGQYLLHTCPNWGEDGGYVESLGYVGYGLVNAMYFLDALKRVTGEDLSPHINPKLIDQVCYCTYRNEEGRAGVINFNDSGAVNLSPDLYALLARHSRCGRAKFLLDYGSPELESTHAMLAYDDAVEAQPPDTQNRNKLFADIGWCVFRSGWDKDASIMAAKFTHGRGHQDIGQFVIRYKGRPFVVDPGVVAYGDPIYRQHLRTSHAHNLVLVDGQCQMQVDGEVLGYAAAPGIGVVEADLTAAYQDLIDSWVRTLVYLEPDCFVVIDRLSGDAERRFEWQVHPKGKTAVQPGLGATIYQDRYEMQLRLLSPKAWRVSTKQGYIGASAAEYLSFVPEQPSEAVTFAAVFAGAERGRNIGVETQKQSGGMAIRVMTPTASHVILTQPGKQGQISGWDVIANAATCAVSRGKGDHRVYWAIVGQGPLVEKQRELAELTVPGDYRAGVG